VVITVGWVSYVVEEKIYVVEAFYKYKCICWEHFGVIHGDRDCI
jgi:hypothetical protein